MSVPTGTGTRSSDRPNDSEEEQRDLGRLQRRSIPGEAWIRRTLTGRRLAFWIILGLAVVFIVPPLAVMLWASITPSSVSNQPGPTSFDEYGNLLRSDLFARVIGDTVVFTAGAVFGAMALGILMAWMVARTDMVGKSLIYGCVFIAFAVPGMIEAIGWIFLLGAGNGLGNQLLRNVIDPDITIPIQSMGGMIAVQALSWAPLVFLLLVGPFRNMDSSLEESALISGASPLKAHRRITLPLMLPSIGSVVILTIIRALQAFEVPLFLGTPAGIQVFTTAIFAEIRLGFMPSYGRAAAYGALLVLTLLFVLALYHYVTASANRYATITGKGYRARRTKLGRWRWVAGLGVLFLFATYVAPMGAMVALSFWPRLGRGGSLVDRFTLGNYEALGTYPNLFDGIRNSVVVAFGAATLAVAISCAAAWIMVRTRLRGRGVLDQVLSVPLVIPGTILGLALLITALRVPFPLYGTLWLFVIAYVISYAPYGMRFIQPALVQTSVELEESARVSGASWLKLFRRILLPLIAPAAVGAWLYVFFHAVRDLSVAAMIYTATTPVIATQLLDMWQDGYLGVLSAYGAAISLVTILVGAMAFKFATRISFRG